LNFHFSKVAKFCLTVDGFERGEGVREEVIPRKQYISWRNITMEFHITKTKVKVGKEES
jgi:hypothetical protein